MKALSAFISFKPHTGKEAELRRLLTMMARESQEEEGVHRYELYESHGGESSFHLFESYTTEAALRSHRATQHYLLFRKQVSALLSEEESVLVLHPAAP